MFGTAQKFLVQVFNFKIVLAENIASDIQKNPTQKITWICASLTGQGSITKNADTLKFLVSGSFR